MEVTACTRAEMPAFLEQTTFADRNRQFVDRLGWDLCVCPSGLETDEYDDAYSEYLAVHKKGQHLGSCRVRPTQYGTMLTDHFSNAFPEAQDFIKMQRGRVFELTRFCRTPDISVEESRMMLEKLAMLLDDFRDRKNITGFLAVVFPQIARFLDTIGVRYLVVSKSRLEQKPVWLICITHAEKVPLDARTPPTEPVQRSKSDENSLNISRDHAHDRSLIM